MNSKTAKMTAEKTVSSEYTYKGNANQVRAILKAMRVKQNSIIVNGYIVVRNGRSYWRIAESTGYGDWLNGGKLEEVTARLMY